MDYIARHGYDVYLVDLRGYGQSTRRPEMDQPTAANEPLVRTETAVKDVGAAVAFIRERRGVAKINLLGWSWGTTSWAGTPHSMSTAKGAMERCVGLIAADDQMGEWPVRCSVLGRL